MIEAGLDNSDSCELIICIQLLADRLTITPTDRQPGTLAVTEVREE